MTASQPDAQPVRTRQRPAIYAGVGLASASVLVLEIVLTRLFAVTQFYHFAFVTVGLALLGFGASGSALAAFPALGRGGPRRWVLLAVGQALATVAAYLVTNHLPFDSYSMAWDPRQVVYLIVYYLALSAPFLFGGAVVGVLLAGWDQPDPIPANRVYAANLVGSGAGCLVALGGLSLVGVVGMVLGAACFASLAALAFARADRRFSRWRMGLLGGLTVLLAVGALSPPGFLKLHLSPYKDLSAVLRLPDGEIVSTEWTAGARIDHVTSASLRSLPGLSYTYEGVPPSQDGLTFDADDLSPVPLVTPSEADFAPYLLASLAFFLREGGDVLVLEPRGGLDVLAALAGGAGTVTAVEPDEPVVRVVAETGLYDDPRVRVVSAEARQYVEQTGRRFDVIDLALTAPYRPVTSGAYSLGENYQLTVEAVEAYLARLRPDGLLAMLRWAQVPPSEGVRLVGLAAEAVRSRGGDPVQSVVALRGYSTVLVLVHPGGFPQADLKTIRDFAGLRRFDMVAASDLAASEANLYNVVPDDAYYRLAGSLLAAGDAEARITPAGHDISAPTDDRPFFGHYFTWAQASDLWSQLGKTWQPFGGAGYFVLLVFLALSALAAAGLILGPLLRLSRRAQLRLPLGLRTWTVAYFGFLGIGFLFVELPVFQKYILLLGRPTTSLAVVLFVLLVASGIGSRMSEKIPWRAGAVLLVGVVAVFPLVLRGLAGWILAAPPVVRVVAAGAALVPLGFLMGIMFPKGLDRIRTETSDLVPWAWGINGAASVISSAAAALLALSFGFTMVLWLGGACYAVCALLARPAGSRSVGGWLGWPRRG